MEEGSFTDSEILVMLGENGTGKTTFIRMLAGMLPPDDEERTEVPEFNVSYKPQKISPKFPSTVRGTDTSVKQPNCDCDMNCIALQRSHCCYMGGWLQRLNSVSHMLLLDSGYLPVSVGCSSAFLQHHV